MNASYRPPLGSYWGIRPAPGVELVRLSRPSALELGAAALSAEINVGWFCLWDRTRKAWVSYLEDGAIARVGGCTVRAAMESWKANRARWEATS